MFGAKRKASPLHGLTRPFSLHLWPHHSRTTFSVCQCCREPTGFIEAFLKIFNLIPSNIHPPSSLPHFIFISHSSPSPCAIDVFYLFLKLLSHYFFFSHFCLILQLIPPSSFQWFNLVWLLLSPGYIENQHSKRQCKVQPH